MKKDKEERRYYAAYDERYKTAHGQGVRWSSDVSTPIVIETIKKYGVARDDKLLEIGCGEGRDARAVLDLGYSLTATDISQEAITYCRKIMPNYKQSFQFLDCLSDEFEGLFDFIYGVAVVHMLVLDKDRNGFYQFIYRH